MFPTGIALPEHPWVPLGSSKYSPKKSPCPNPFPSPKSPWVLPDNSQLEMSIPDPVSPRAGCSHNPNSWNSEALWGPSEFKPCLFHLSPVYPKKFPLNPGISRCPGMAPSVPDTGRTQNQQYLLQILFHPLTPSIPKNSSISSCLKPQNL